MNKLILTLLASFCLATTALAQIPVYKDNDLTINQAVVIGPGGAQYYGDVHLSQQDDRSFALASAERRNLAVVDAAGIVATPGVPGNVAVEASGMLSIPCVALEDPAVLREGNTFTVVLAETTQKPDAVCMSLAAMTPFEVSVALDTVNLPAGTYTVKVNNAQTSFDWSGASLTP
jgi:hypothetical protein